MSFLTSLWSNLHLPTILGPLLGVIGIWQSGRVANMVRDGVLRSTDIDHELAPFARQAARLIWIIVCIAVAMMVAGASTSGLVAFLSASGLGLTLALQGVLSNIAAGVALIMFRPFRAEDEIEAAGVQGRVHSLKLMSTELRTSENVHVSLPNAKVWGAEIRNFSTEKIRRFDTLIPVPNAVDADDAMRVLLAIVTRELAVLPQTALAPAPLHGTRPLPGMGDAPTVSVEELKEGVAVLRVRAWCAGASVDSCRTKILTEARRELAALPGWRSEAAKPDAR